MRRLALLLLASCARDTVRVQEAEVPRAEGAVDRGIKWLAVHQDVDEGRWDAKGFMKHDPAEDRCDGAGNPAFDVGLTALATLAFLGGGFTDRGPDEANPYARNVRQALRYLMESQEKDGCFGPRSMHTFIYNHVTATFAMCEAFALTRNPRYRMPAQDGIAFILAAQNPGAGWRYDPRGGESDTSVTVWCVTALDSARRAGFEVPQQAFHDSVKWVEKMTDPATGRVGYNYPGGASARYEGIHLRFPPKGEAMTAAGMRIRFLAGAGAAEANRKGAKLCLAQPPKWGDGTADMYYWYFGTLALRELGGEEWRAWDMKLETAVLGHQQVAGASAGSWDPIDPWGLTEGGRIFSTALLTLCLEGRRGGR